MLIFELLEDPGAKKLAGLATLLSDRAKDRNAKMQINQDAFIEAAKSLNINITKDNLGDLINQVPLKNILEPLDPTSDIISFKGDTEATTGMSVDQARATVDSNAKAAMKRGMKK